MPLIPARKSPLMPVRTVKEVLTVFEKRFSIVNEPNTVLRRNMASNWEDHMFYIGAVCPQYFRPLQEEAITGKECSLLDPKLRLSFVTLLYLLYEAPDSCVEFLLSQRHEGVDPLRIAELLATIGTDSAFQALAEYAQKTEVKQYIEDMGYWLPENGDPVKPRFVRERLAVKIESVKDLSVVSHPVGLPVSEVVTDSEQDIITWHYLTLDTTKIESLSTGLPSKLHLVSPRRIVNGNCIARLPKNYDIDSMQCQKHRIPKGL